VKLRWKILAVLLGIFTGLVGAFVLDWLYRRQLRKKGYEVKK
jgi:hypothetical protein